MQPSLSPNVPIENVPTDNVPIEQVVTIPRCDRWQIYHRLQELMIPCSCPSDGSLRVEVRCGIELILVRSIVQRFTAPRQELVNWLERCWCTTVVCEENH